MSTDQGLWGSHSTAAQPAQCPYCGCMPHQYIGQCPQIAKIEYYPDGTIKSVEMVR